MIKTLLAAVVLLLAAACSMADRAETNLVVSKSSPALTLRIDEAFRPLPKLSFPIADLTDAERHIFVEADAEGRMRRAVIVQFENVQAGSDFRFVFPPKPPQPFGDEIYRFGAFAYDDERAAAERPDREAGLTRAHFIAHGLKPPRYWRVARLARVSDPEGESEVIIFYTENADADYPSGTEPPVDEGGDIVLDEVAKDVLLQRLRESVTPVSG